MTDLDTLLTGGHDLAGGTDGTLLHRPPGDRYWYDTGIPDPCPETSDLIRRLDSELAAAHAEKGLTYRPDDDVPPDHPTGAPITAADLPASPRVIRTPVDLDLARAALSEHTALMGRIADTFQTDPQSPGSFVCSVTEAHAYTRAANEANRIKDLIDAFTQPAEEATA